MRPLREQLQREVASLHSFVEAVSRSCVPPRQSVSYSEPSTVFFDYIGHLAERTKAYISGFESHAADSDDDFVEARTELWTLRRCWRELHQFIKPSADADTLNQPVTMIAALVERFQELQGFANTQFTIFHTDSFEYSQANPSSTEDAVAQLARVLGAKSFPADLGLIGMPNSQGGSLFLNSLLAHEMGEYACARRNVEGMLAGPVKKALAHRIGGSFDKEQIIVQSRMQTTVLKWAREVFCDLFAVRLVGPSFSFAYSELYDLPNILRKDGGLLDEHDAQTQFLSYSLYPSHPFRLKAQADLLKEEGWWDLIKDLDSRHRVLLEQLLAADYSLFFNAEISMGGQGAYVAALIDLIPEIKAQVVLITDGIDNHLHEFGLLWKAIGEYLADGVVPSSLLIEVDHRFKEVHPSPVTLLNAGHRFCLEGTEELMSRINGQDLSSTDHRTVWMRRIENWTSKALEDVMLLRRLPE